MIVSAGWRSAATRIDSRAREQPWMSPIAMVRGMRSGKSSVKCPLELELERGLEAILQIAKPYFTAYCVTSQNKVKWLYLFLVKWLYLLVPTWRIGNSTVARH